MSWTDQRVERLRHLWTVEGLSCAQIANDLGGVTRNGVIGKIHRLGLSSQAPMQKKRKEYSERKAQDGPKLRRVHRRTGPVAPSRAAQLKIAVAAPRLELSVEEVAQIKTLNIPLLELEAHHCRAVIGEPQEMVFCGRNKREEGKPWCPQHHAVLTQPSHPGRRRAWRGR